MASKKMTQRQGFTRAIEVFTQLGETEMVTFFEERIAQLDKKSNTPRKRTPRQIENDAYKEIILTSMTEDNEYTIDDMLMYFGLPLDMTNHRVSAILTQLVDDGQVVRLGVVKGKQHFKLA